MRILIVALGAVALAGCVSTGEDGYRPTALASNTDVSADEMAKLVAADRKMVSAGLAPPEIVNLDMEIVKLAPEGQAILASNDPVRARAWSKKMHTLVAAKNEATTKFAAKSIAKRNAFIAAYGDARPDPCRAPNGTNICAPPPQEERMCVISTGPVTYKAPC